MGLFCRIKSIISFFKCFYNLGRERLKLKVENTIRWRQSFDSEGKAFKESNARIVRYVTLLRCCIREWLIPIKRTTKNVASFLKFHFRWSDGSMSLHLGNEIFDVHKQPLAGDHNHMFIRQVRKGKANHITIY